MLLGLFYAAVRNDGVVLKSWLAFPVPGKVFGQQKGFPSALSLPAIGRMDRNIDLSLARFLFLFPSLSYCFSFHDSGGFHSCGQQADTEV